MIRELQSLTRPAFNLQAHLARSAEVSAFDLTSHVRKRQPINVVRSTCAKLRRVL
jgi:hypothetical protein